jgi:hypothetical protein
LPETYPSLRQNLAGSLISKKGLPKFPKTGGLVSRGMISQPPFDHILIVPGSLLNFTDELLHITLGFCKVVVPQLTPPFQDLTLELVPIAFNLIPIH